MFFRNNKHVDFALLQTINLAYGLQNSNITYLGTEADLRAKFVSAAEQILIGNGYTEAGYERTLITPVGTVVLYGPVSTSTRFAHGFDLVEETPIEQIVMKAPAYAVRKTIQRRTFAGTITVSTIGAALEAALASVMARRVATGTASTARAVRLETNLTILVQSLMTTPPAAVWAAQKNATGLYCSLKNGVRFSGATKNLASSTFNTTVDWFVASLSANTNLGGQEAQVRSAISDGMASTISRLIDINSMVTTPSEASVQTALADMASFVAQPLVLMDIVGSNIDEIDATAFAELVVDLARKISVVPGVTTSFNVNSAPRSLGELLYFSAGVTDTALVASIDAFYHRNIRPEITPASSAGKFPILFDVHPVMLDGTYSVVSDSTGRILTITKGGVSVTATYPDWLNQQIRFHATLSAPARLMVDNYHQLCDIVFGLMIGARQGQISPERLAQLGITGIGTSLFVAVV